MSQGGRDAPDFTVCGTKNGRPLKTPDHAVGVFEVKKVSALENAKAIYQEKKKYIQPQTQYFFLLDQEKVIRHDLCPTANYEFT